MKVTHLELELNDGNLVFDEFNKVEPLTELQVMKMFMLLREVEGYRLGKLDTVLYISVNGDDYEISSNPYDFEDEDDIDGTGENDIWGDPTVLKGSMVELDKMNTYENRFVDNNEWMRNPMSVCFEYDVVDGDISDPDEDTHYGGNILSDEETVMVIRKLMDEGYVSDNETGMISVYDDMITIEVVGHDTLLIPKK